MMKRKVLTFIGFLLLMSQLSGNDTLWLDSINELSVVYKVPEKSVPVPEFKEEIPANTYDRYKENDAYRLDQHRNKRPYRNLPPAIKEVPVAYQHIVKIKKYDFVRLIFYDGGAEDGDVISLNVNGKWQKKKYTLKNLSWDEYSRENLMIYLHPGDNYIITEALSEGLYAPCTLCILVSNGKKEKLITLYSSKNYMGGIKIICKYREKKGFVGNTIWE